MTEIRFCLDENVDNDITRGLRTRSIDVITTTEANLRTESDITHLEFALEEERVIITQDDDFLRLASQGNIHAGIVYYKSQTRSTKQILQKLFLIHAQLSSQDMQNHIEFI